MLATSRRSLVESLFVRPASRTPCSTTAETPVLSMQRRFSVWQKLRDEGRVPPDVLRIPDHDRIEIRLHLEGLLEVRIVGIEEVVARRVSDHRDPHVDLDRLGLDRAGGEEVERVKALDIDLLVLQRTLQGLPDARLRHRVEQIEDEKSPVGPKDAPGPDVQEIAPPVARTIDDLLDRAEEVPVVRARSPGSRAAVPRRCCLPAR